MNAPHPADPPPALGRRKAAFRQADVARAIRAAREHAGPNWRVEVEVEGNIVRVYQGDAPITQAPVARGIGIVP